MLNQIKENLKNIIGWKTRRKIVVFSIDDYGNVRMSSREALQNLEKAGLKLGRFDRIDALETKQDLEEMLETLSSVKDKNGNSAILSPFVVPCNIDYEKMADDAYKDYHYELLPETFSKLSSEDPEAYKGAWDLWKKGMSERLLVPQFHGREHFNLKVFREKLKNRDFELLISLKNKANPAFTTSGYTTIQYPAAFDFWDFKENSAFESIIEDGLNAFEKVFGYRSVHFNSPAGREHPIIHQYLKNNGITYLDTPMIKKEHIGLGKYRTVLNYTGKRDHLDMIYMVRNVVFEPTEGSLNWVNFTMRQVENAFRWHRPAIISSHRVNFCGHLSEANRTEGIKAFKILLKNLVTKWPDIEFMSSKELGDLIQVTSKK